MDDYDDFDPEEEEMDVDFYGVDDEEIDETEDDGGAGYVGERNLGLSDGYGSESVSEGLSLSDILVGSGNGLSGGVDLGRLPPRLNVGFIFDTDLTCSLDAAIHSGENDPIPGLEEASQEPKRQPSSSSS